MAASLFSFRDGWHLLFADVGLVSKVISVAQASACVCLLNRHGDLLFLFPSSLAGPSSEMETSIPPGLKALGAPTVVEDEIDQYLSRQDGKIYRSRDPQL